MLFKYGSFSTKDFYLSKYDWICTVVGYCAIKHSPKLSHWITTVSDYFCFNISTNILLHLHSNSSWCCKVTFLCGCSDCSFSYWLSCYQSFLINGCYFFIRAAPYYICIGRIGWFNGSYQLECINNIQLLRSFIQCNSCDVTNDFTTIYIDFKCKVLLSAIIECDFTFIFPNVSSAAKKCIAFLCIRRYIKWGNNISPPHWFSFFEVVLTNETIAKFNPFFVRD